MCVCFCKYAYNALGKLHIGNVILFGYNWKVFSETTLSHGSWFCKILSQYILIIMTPAIFSVLHLSFLLVPRPNSDGRVHPTGAGDATACGVSGDCWRNTKKSCCFPCTWPNGAAFVLWLVKIIQIMKESFLLQVLSLCTTKWHSFVCSSSDRRKPISE